MKLSLGRIAELISATGEFDANAVAQGYSIDSRSIAPGELFFAVRGERLDGHDFVPSAIESGAVAAVVSKDEVTRFPGKTNLLVVSDTLLALQAMGSAVRRIWGKIIIAVTGSTGKTTTKEAIAHLLATRFRVLKSEGNLNNHFGLPMQLLRLEPQHEVAVMELGMSHAGEITALAKLAQPDMGVVTNVAPVHLEFFTSIAEIARAKYELIASLSPRATAVLNIDDEYVSQFGRDFAGRVVTYGLHRPADVRAEAIEQRGASGSVFEIVAGSCREKATLPLIGEHNIYNALAAVAVALQRGVTPSEAVGALASLAPADKRGQVLQLAGVTVINDCYNSNPKALKAMVDSLASMPAARRIVVAGEMLELGPGTEDLHRRCGAHIAQRNVDILIGVRGAAKYMVEAAAQAKVRAQFVQTPQQAGEWLAREVRPGDLVLLKASRGVRLEGALETWKAALSTSAEAATKA
jgi:UDP-N-acetylmuramoyl-tripeptide--D-alanyl-D-alanine ligase